MKEQIYTIPVNEAFDGTIAKKLCVCPFCLMHEKLQQSELELILGASMMEPDIRIKTNDEGFCREHYDMMLKMKNRLGLALMLQSHIDEVRKKIFPSGLSVARGKGQTAATRLSEHNKSCYVCGKIDFHLEKMLQTAVYLWDTSIEFKQKLSSQPFFCLEHYEKLLRTGMNKLSKKSFSDFYESVCRVEREYVDKLYADVSRFCDKFDYRHADEPWGDAKDAPDRAVRLLTRG